LAVNGAVAPQALAHETGTALAPLGRTVGPAAQVLGSAFAILALGMLSITFSLALFGLMLERLPPASPVIVALPRRAARLLFEQRGRSRAGAGLRLWLVYLGLDGGAARFRPGAGRGGASGSAWFIRGGTAASPVSASTPSEAAARSDSKRPAAGDGRCSVRTAPQPPSSGSPGPATPEGSSSWTSPTPISTASACASRQA